MSQANWPGRAALAAAAVAALGLGGAFALWYHHRQDAGPGNSPRPETGGFRDARPESGITFRMNFLPGEQGEKFKINLYDHGCGVAVGDYDGDGRDDIYFCNQLGPNALYRNKGDGTFEDVTAKAGVGLGDRVCVGATFADYDNDGKQDLYVTSTRGGNVLFHNNGDGTFSDVTEKAGLTHNGHSQTAVFFDYDNDGRLDLFLTNTAAWTADASGRAPRYFPGPPTFWEMAVSPKEYNVLYRNNGNGTFTDVTKEAGLKGKGWGGDVAVFDYDEDGRLDLLVTNMFGRSQLYHNTGGGTFTDVTRAVLGRTSWGAIGARAFDFNNDGRLDLLLTDMHSDMWLPWTIDPLLALKPDELKKKFPTVMGLPAADDSPARKKEKEQARESEKRYRELFKIRNDEVLFGNTFYKKLPSGKFEEISDRAGLETFWPWGIATGDFDNDGYEDVFLPSGMGYPYFYYPNALLMNNGDETFTDRAAQSGIEPPPGGRHAEERIGDRRPVRSSRCAAVADFDGDGRLDLVVNNFNDRPYFFRNEFPRKSWIAFRLRGTKSNRDAIGAVVRVYQGGKVLTRQVQAAGGYLSQSSKTLHFGLGDNPKIDKIEVTWPGGARQEVKGFTLNTLNPPIVEHTGGKEMSGAGADAG